MASTLCAALVTDPTQIFFVVLIIILLAPIVMNKLRIPHIIGMVLAGIAIGEHGLNLLPHDASFTLFGHVGLLYIMFLAGLEMNLSDLKKYGGRMAVFGVMTFAVPFALGFCASRWLLGYSSAASVLLACILSSNTLIAYPIVSRFGLQKHRAVVLSVGSSMLALTLALLVLAGFSASYSGDAGLLFWLFFAAKVVAFTAGVVMIIPRLTRWFFSRHSDAVSLFTYVLAVMFCCAAVSDLCGLEDIFGAFMAGVVLNRFIPNVSPLMNRLEFTGNAVFIPYFLIGVGMIIEFDSMFHSTTTMLVVLCTVFFGTFGKAIAAYATAALMQLDRSSGHIMFGLTTAHAAGSIAMMSVGLSLYGADGQPLVDSSMLNGIVVMILFTCIISSLVVDQASQQILLRQQEQEPEAAEPRSDDEKIMLPLSRLDDTDSLVKLAILMRNERLNRGLIALNVVYDDASSDKKQAEGWRILDEALTTATSADVRMQVQSRLATNIANGIKHAFKENDASEIIMGLHRRRSEQDSFWGTYAQGMISEINRQIMLCRITRPLSTLRQIHVALPSRSEFEVGFSRWLERMARLAENLGCRIVFHGREVPLQRISDFMAVRHPRVRAAYERMEHWKQFTELGSQVKADQLLVVVTARQGTMSYKATFELLPAELTRYFSDCSLIVIYPDQNGQPQDTMTFTAPQQHGGTSLYDQIIAWFISKKK